MNMPGSSAEDLLWARDLLINPPAGRRRLIGADLRAALVDLHDFWLAGHATRAGITGGGVALLAVGALGRKEFVPYSDLDLVLVHDGRDEVAGLAEQLWYPLWASALIIRCAPCVSRSTSRAATCGPRWVCWRRG